MRSDAALQKFSDNLTGDKRLIALIISVLQQTIAARSYEKTYNLAGIRMSYIHHNHLSERAPTAGSIHGKELVGSNAM